MVPGSWLGSGLVRNGTQERPEEVMSSEESSGIWTQVGKSVES